MLLRVRNILSNYCLYTYLPSGKMKSHRKNDLAKWMNAVMDFNGI